MSRPNQQPKNEIALVSMITHTIVIPNTIIMFPGMELRAKKKKNETKLKKQNWLEQMARRGGQ